MCGDDVKLRLRTLSYYRRRAAATAAIFRKSQCTPNRSHDGGAHL